MAEEEQAAVEDEAPVQPNAEEEEAAPQEEEEPVEPIVGLNVLFTSSSLNNFFSRAMLGRLASLGGEDNDGLPKVEKIVAMDWPQGKHGHLPVEGLPERIEMLSVDDVTSDAFKEAVIAADVIILECHNHVIESRQALETLLDTDFVTKKSVIGVTNVLSWSRTEMVEGEVLCEEDYVRRLGHPNYTELQDLEKRISRAHDDYLRTHVLSAGVLYGLGEDHFYDAFKASWEGKPVPMPLLPSNGENILPTIHIDDLVMGVTRLLDPETCGAVSSASRHMLAVDHGKSSVRAMLEAVSMEMSHGEVQTLSEDETLLLKNNDFFSIHQVMEPAALDLLLDGHWRYQGGLIANIKALTEEFKTKHNLPPQRLIVTGPPLSGKTRLVSELSSYYGLPVLDESTIQAAFLEAASLPEEEYKHPEWGSLAPPESEEEGATRRPIEVSAVSDPELLGSLVRWKLSSKEYGCSGWILDHFPLTKSQADAIFLKPPPTLPEGEEPPAEEPPKELEPAFAPNKVFWLEADDDYLNARRAALEPSQQVEGYTDDEAAFQGKVSEYRASQEGEDSSRKLFESETMGEGVFMELAPGSWPDTSVEAREALGPPKNFSGPGHLLSDDWVAPMEENVVDEPLPVPPAIAAIRGEKAEKLANKARDAEIAENQSLYEDAMPLREHLLKVAMPAVTEALVLTCEEQPADPIDFVQRFLFDYEERENRNTVAKAREVKAAAAAKKAAAEAEAARAEREKGAVDKKKK